MIQEIWQHHRGFREEEELRKVRVKSHCNQYHYPAFFAKVNEKFLHDTNCLKSMAHHAAGIGNCTQNGLTIPSHPSSEMHLGQFHRPYGISELECKLPNRGLPEGEESHTRVTVDQGNRSSQIVG